MSKLVYIFTISLIILVLLRQMNTMENYRKKLRFFKIWGEKVPNSCFSLDGCYNRWRTRMMGLMMKI